MRCSGQLVEIREARLQRLVGADARRSAYCDAFGNVESGDDSAAAGAGKLRVRGQNACVHDVDHASGTGMTTVIVAVEVCIELIDSIEMPEQVDMRVLAAGAESG